MAFNDLQLKAASESGIIAAHKNIAKLSLFAKSFSELNGTPGASVAVPVYDLSSSSAFVVGSNDYGTTQDIDGALITLDQHYVRSVGITDVQQAETGVRWIADTTAALADTLTRGVESYVMGLINSTNCPLSAEVTLNSKSAVANLYATAAANDIPVNDAVVVLSPTNFATVLGLLDASVYGGSEAVQLGIIPGLYGFAGFVCSPSLTGDLEGAIVARNAIGIASRVVYPGTEGAYPEFWTVTTDEGWSCGMRRFENLSAGKSVLAGDVLFGSAILQPNRIVRLV